jgi:membrane fusion protein (multidrug efflux system)
MRRLLPILAFSCIAALSGCGQKAASSQPTANVQAAAPISLSAVHPKRGEITRQLTLPATVLPNLQATLYAKVTGYLQKISVDKGDVVKHGQEIAVIEAPELIADAAKFKADLDIAELDYKRTVNAQEKAPDLIVAQSIDAAKARYLAAKAGLERADTLLGFSKITAPFAGVVTRRFVDPGAFIPAATGGAPQNAAIVTIVDSSTVRVQIAVPEPEVPRIKKDLPVRITVDELPGRNFDGTITRDTRSLDETKTMLAEVDLANPKGELLPGMYATAKIGIEKHPNALTLPVDALVMEKTAAFVFKAVDGKAKKTPVKVGFNDGARFETIDGVNEGDNVLLVGKTPVADGAPVMVTEAK